MSAAAAAAAAAFAAAAILRVEEENALLNGGSYIRDGVPEDFTGKIGQQLARRACLAYAQNPDSIPPDRGLQYEGACRPYLAAMGAPGGPSLKVPFRGGQCAGAQYNFSFEYRVRASTTFQCGAFSPWQAGSGFVGQGIPVGPIASITQEILPNGSLSFRDRLERWPIVAANGTFYLNLEGDGVRYHLSSCGPAYELRNITCVRLGGLPDDCGGPQPIYGPPPPPPPTLPPPDGPVTIAPDIDIDVSVNLVAIGAVIVNIGTGPITIDPFGDDDDGGGGGGGGGRPPGDVGTPGSPVGPGPSGDIEGEAPPGQVLGALRISLLAVPRNAKQYSPGVYRGAYYAYLGTSDGLDHDPAGAMATDGQLILPEKENLTHWKVRPNLGYELSVTPLYYTLD